MQATLPKAFTDSQAAYLELFTATGKAVLDSASQITPLSIETVRGALNEVATLATTLPGAKTPQDVVTLNSNFADALRDSTTAYTRSVYEIAAETQGTLTRLVESHVASFQESIQSAISQATAGAPSSATGVADFFKQFAAAGASSYEQATKALRQAAETAVSRSVPTPAAARKGKQAV